MFIYPCKPNPIAPNSIFFDQLDKDPNWIGEKKENGIRAEAVKDTSTLTIWTRHHTTIETPIPNIWSNQDAIEIRESLRVLPPLTILDGELKNPRRIKDGEYRYILFDILMFKGELLINCPLTERRLILELCFMDYLANCQFIDCAEWYREGKKAVYYESLTADYEGVVLKNLNSKYITHPLKSAQNPNWIKVKKVEDHVYV